MNNELKLVVNKQEEEKDISMSNITLMTAGTGGDDKNWLSKLPLGTIFLIQDVSSADFNLGHFKIVDHTDKSVILASSLTNTPIFVDPNRFTQKYRMYENLGVFTETDAIDEVEEKTEATEEK
jgi:hypothetical protein